MMNFTTSIPHLPLLVLVLGISQSAYGQESLPETVARHEKEIVNLQQKVDQLESALKRFEEQGMVGSGGSESTAETIYFLPVRNSNQSCRISKTYVSYGKNEKIPFTSTVTFDAETGILPYNVEVTLICSIYSFSCRTSGLVNLLKSITYAFEVKRSGSKVCIISSVELQ